MHDQRDAILSALPVREVTAFPMRPKSLAGKVIGQSAGALGRLPERAAARTADGHQPVGRGFGDRVEHRPDGPFAHG